MAKSQNGWPVQNTKANLWPHTQVGPILAGPVWVVLAAFLRRYHSEIEPIGPQSGCYNRRKIAGSRKWSNHASATAVDLNWNMHPVGGKYTGYSAAQVTAVYDLLEDFPALRWGGPAFRDPMHYEIAPGVTPAQVERQATKLLQSRLAQLGYDLGKAGIDGVRGDKTLAALFTFQTDAGLKPDSIDGPKTWAALTNWKGNPAS